ncbi:MAG: alpha/beta fold hydrolase [Chloroflexota bacterium]
MNTRLKFFGFALTLVCLLSVVGSSFAHGEEVVESSVTLDNGVVGTLVQPAAEAPAPVVLLLHGFASSRDEVGDMYKRLAGELAEYGIGSLRIDFRGWGESAGEMTDSTVSGQVEDAAAAYDYLSGLDWVDSECVGLVGFSLGGSIAVFSAGEHPDWYQSMALWSTGGDLNEAFLEELGQENFDTAASDGEVTIDLGFRMVTLGNDFFTGLDAYDYEAEFANYDGALMVVAGSEDGSAEYLDWYRENAQGNLKASFLVEGADHIYNVLTEDQSHSDAVIEKTAAWFALSL